MDRATILQNLREILENDRGEKYDSMEESVTLREGLGLDSVDLITMVMQVQDRFRVVLANEELEKISTVKELLDVIQAKLAQQAQAA
jgi:acyl carrier protein